MRRILFLTALIGLCLAPAAHGASSVVLRGAGFGHGIGMSQYGAYGFAQKGSSYQRILSHYYTGTRLTTAPSKPVRVLLQASDPYVRVRGASRGPEGARLNPTVTYIARPARGGRVKLTGRGKTVGTFRSPLRLSSSRPMRLMGTAINGLRSGTYRGAFELRGGAGGGVTAVNSLPIDDYIKGVIAAEMPSSWHSQALRAQAVTARTYALATSKTSGGVFDQYPDTRSQVYRGVKAEAASSNRAVADTSRQILTYGGKPAVTYFFSTSGGKTENVENSFVGSSPKAWLKSRNDPYDDISPKHRWRKRFSPSSLGAKLGAPGRYKKIRVIKRGLSPRIVRARVYGSRGTKVLTGPQIRARLGLFDTWVYFSTVSSSQVKRAKGARGARSAFPEIAGTFDPAPKARKLLVERRERGSWTRVSRIATTARGRYRSTLSRAGVYRVRSGTVAGPAVRIR
ncbi:MAG TPA: SpoIID/LytB domain-containing protein [Thermoleophilaceae bacterium]|nr:SpoIID/LytB domain-containing protein [Thermoleophilaceae bacterium]